MLATSLMLALITGVLVMKNVELTQVHVDEEHVAWLVIAGCGCSYDLPLQYDLILFTDREFTEFFLFKEGFLHVCKQVKHPKKRRNKQKNERELTGILKFYVIISFNVLSDP